MEPEMNLIYDSVENIQGQSVREEKRENTNAILNQQYLTSKFY